MKKITVSTLVLFVLLCFMFSAMAQNLTAAKAKTTATKKAAVKKTMTWTTKSAAALELAEQGARYVMNIEFAQAYEKFSAALKLDPDFTVALAFMSNITVGETKKDFIQKAISSAANKTAGEKLFASLADPNNSEAVNRETWAKLHDMFPDGTMIGNFYVITRATPEERFAAAEDYIKKFPESAAMYNTIAYYYMLDKKDMESAKKNFEKYIELYPTGCNPYDSMGEYYLSNGDKENAKKYYSLALDKYPFNISSVNALDKMKEEKKIEPAQ
ncbi:MAG: hypothetical protein H7Z13_20220 [Ferruginibacter sp.]|nr:hypothetical protein [Ferruginibacter sp.]